MSEAQTISTKDLRRVVHEDAIPRMQKVRFDKNNPIHFIKIGTYLSVLEQSIVISDIVDSGLGYHAYPTLRCQMEGLADLINLNNDEGYLAHLEMQHEDSFHKQFVAGKLGNPYFYSLARPPEFSNELSKLGRKVKKLRGEGARRLEPKEKMALADMALEHEALYGLLNDHCHGGIRALMARHVRISEDDHAIVGFNHGSADEFDAPLQTSLDVTLRASMEIHTTFGTGEEAFFLSRIREMSLEPAEVGV